MHVGIRELRAGLSHWLDLVGRGESVVVTDRGRPVARLTRVDEAPAIQRLIEEGIVRPAKRPKTRAAGRPRIRAKASISGIVSDQRR